MSALAIILCLAVIYNACPLSSGHGNLVDPPGRSSAWRYGFNTPKNYQDMELFCGGFINLSQKQGGKCGVCGDPAQGPLKNECPDGEFCKKVIVKKYTKGQTIPVTVNFNTNHGGTFVFRICPVTDESKEVTWECLRAHELTVVESNSVVWPDPTTPMNGDVTMHVKLPPNLTCPRCVFQWEWVCGNRWGKCANGTEGMGCGPQETFVNCADISIS